MEALFQKITSLLAALSAHTANKKKRRKDRVNDIQLVTVMAFAIYGLMCLVAKAAGYMR